MAHFGKGVITAAVFAVTCLACSECYAQVEKLKNCSSLKRLLPFCVGLIELRGSEPGAETMLSLGCILAILHVSQDRDDGGRSMLQHSLYRRQAEIQIRSYSDALP